MAGSRREWQTRLERLEDQVLTLHAPLECTVAESAPLRGDQIAALKEQVAAQRREVGRF